MKAADIAKALGGKKGSKGWMAKCPCHQDSTASLSIDDGENGKPVVNCFAGCANADVIGALEGRGLWERRQSRIDAAAGKRIVATTYAYNGLDGKLLFEVVRYEPKGFAQRRPDGNGRWIWSTREIAKVPYRLPELREAIADGRMIFVVEGEKDVDNLTEAGVPATCNPGGAMKWQSELSEHFAGANVVIIPDNDDPGRGHAEQVAGKLSGIASEVRVLELPTGKDVTEWLAGGGSSAKLYEMADNARLWATPTSTSTTSAPTTFWHGEANDIAVSWLVKGLLPEVGTGLLSGQWGLFKSFTLIDLGASLITGNPFAGHRVKRTGGVLVLAAEGANTFGSRLAGLVKDGRLPQEPQPFAWTGTFPSLLSPNAFSELEKLIVNIEREMATKWNVPLVLIAVDTMAAAAQFTDENDNAEGQRAMNLLGQLADRFRCCVIGLDHFGKDVSQGTRGGSAKEAAADAVLALLGDRQLSGEVTKSRLAVRKTRHGCEVGREIPFTPRTIVMGEDQDGDPVTTRVIDWQTDGTVRSAQSGRKWGLKQQTLRKSIIAALLEQGQPSRPYGAEGPMVRAVDRKAIRDEFFRNITVESVTEEKAYDAKLKRFNRDMEKASSEELIGVRDNLVWLVLRDDETAQAAVAGAWKDDTPSPELVN